MHRTLDHKIKQKCQHQNHLDPKANDCGNNVGDGRNQPGKIHFTENAGVFRKGIGITGQAAGKISPDGIAAQIEQVCGHTIGADTGNLAEHKGLDNTAHQRRQEQPRRTQDRLLVRYDKITLDEQKDQILVAPNLFQV